MLISPADLKKFEKKFDPAYEDRAVIARGQFLQSYPLDSLAHITLDDYVIGKGTPTFCAWVEAKTRPWANMQGATSKKFGIYFGKTKSDPSVRYRFSKKFGETTNEAFAVVKQALLSLVESGRSKNFREIDANPLSQMFKAKILSLYFPDDYLNICSAEHLEEIALAIGIPEQQFTSTYQHLLAKEKLKSDITKSWSNPKFMSFLYAKFIGGNLEEDRGGVVEKPKEKSNRRVDFEEIAEIRNEIGKLSEEFAIEWERNRLIGLGYPELAKKIKDRRQSPSYGYDYLSFSAPGHERFIEVKSAGKDRRGGSFRFYLSENERAVSESATAKDDYYFYLVFFDKTGKPCDVLVKQAKDMYENSEMTPCAYVVRFDRNE
ncbi:MAG: DUF3883 domain-containing protein [Vogesella sp.]|uniref:DUF3883 domain-containing protein n=1 Tax=Vogesella sp. TaxID=1904252 RepID=UPI00391A7941